MTEPPSTPDAMPPVDGGLAEAVPDAEGRPQTLGQKFFRWETLLSFAIALVILVLAIRGLRIDPAAIVANIREANLWWFLAGTAVWIAVIFARAARWRWLLLTAGIDKEHGYDIPGVVGITEIVWLAWFVNCVVPAKLGDAYRCWLLKQESGAPFSSSLGTIVTERLVDLVTLCLLMVTTGLYLFHGELPSEATMTFQLAVVLLGIGGIGLGALWFARERIEARLPHRLQGQFGRLSEAIFASMRKPLPLLLMSIGLWVAEGVRFWCMAQALHAHLPFPAALFISLMGSLLTALPFTPAGLGVVEAGTGAVMVGVMKLNNDVSFSIILLDRVATYWLVVAVGIVLYVKRFGRSATRAVASA